MQTHARAGLFSSPLAVVDSDAVNELIHPEQRFVVNRWIGEKASEDPNDLLALGFIGFNPMPKGSG